MNRLDAKGYEKLMKTARKTNVARDVIDRGAGFAAPGDGTFSMLLRNAMSAIASGIQTAEASSLAEGLAMLEVLHVKLEPDGPPFTI